MLSMVIADDEIIVREFLRDLDIWDEMSVQIVAEAADGQEAYDLCARLKPDILMTDIRMPFMDGLEVSLKLKEQGENIRFIIVSGVQDFDYAKTALSVDAEGYILKPIKPDEIREVMKKVITGITMERNRDVEIRSMKTLLGENMYLIRENFLRNLVAGSGMNRKDIAEKLEYYCIPLKPQERVMVSVIQVDDYQKSASELPEEERQLMNFQISGIVNDVLEAWNCGICFCMNDGEHIVIFNDKVHYNERFAEACNEIIACVDKYIRQSVSIGCGKVVESVAELKFSYDDARSVLKYKFYMGKKSILNSDDIRNFLDIGKKSIEFPNLYELENDLVNSARLGNIEEVKEALAEVFDRSLSPEKSLPVDYIQSVCIEMVCMLTRALYELEESIDKIVAKRSSIMDTIYRIGNLKELKKYMTEILLRTADYFATKHNNKNLNIIVKIKQIIDSRYMEDIGVSMLAEEVYLSPNYISLIFKKETGENITDYIKKTRMEAAKELLKNPDLKIHEISEMVGFDNPNYFSLVFKKYAGILPQKFRTGANG